jgi:exosortase E/protease (VPEID-CTERM system)
VSTPTLETLTPAPSRFGAVPRLLFIAGVLTAETLLLSGLIQLAPLDTLTGAADVVHIVQHWLFRYLIAYVVSFAMLIYLRGVSVGPMLAAAQNAPVRYRWLLAHVVLLLPFAVLTGTLYREGSVPFVWLAVGWHVCGVGVVLALFAAMAPRQVWMASLRQTGGLPLFAQLPAAGALIAFKASQLLWAPTAAVTFQLVQMLVRPFYPSLTIEAPTLTLITEHFAVTVSEVCSGLEGMGLMLAFCAAWLWYFRREFIFPRSLLIIPAAVLLIYILNAVRIAALVLIGEAGYQRVASIGFHSQAGWIAFNIAAFAVAIVAKRSPWLNRTAREVNVSTNDATPAYLMPLLAILAAGMIAHALSAGFDLLYPLRLICAALVLWFYRNAYRTLDWRCSWRGVLIGVVIFGLWAAFARLMSAPHGMPDDLAQLPVSIRSGWIACRAMAAVITVPIAEELAYRGYLMRRIAASEFDALPLTGVKWPAVGLSSIAFGITHGGYWLPGVAAGLAYGALAVKTGKFGESVVAHATTNSLIAATVLVYGQWQLW